MHECKQENKIQKLCEFKGSTEASIANIEKAIEDIKDNHLAHIYSELKKLAGRPSWLILVIMTFLCSALTLVIRELLTRI